MSDEATPQSPLSQTPIPWGLVEHVHRTKTGKTTMQISMSIETRARLAQAALDLGCSKLALIRTAISQFLTVHEENRSSGQELAFLATSEIVPPVPGLVAGEPTKAEPEPVPAPEPVMEPEPESATEPDRGPVLLGSPAEPVKAPRRTRKQKS